jgi:hypothetical protein
MSVMPGGPTSAAQSRRPTAAQGFVKMIDEAAATSGESSLEFDIFGKKNHSMGTIFAEGRPQRAIVGWVTALALLLYTARELGVGVGTVLRVTGEAGG